jgi:hypothetical protein
LDESLDVLAEHEDDLAQLVLAPRKGTRRPSAERLLQNLVCLCGDGAGIASASLNDEMRRPGRKRTSSISSMVLVLNSGMFKMSKGLSGVGCRREKFRVRSKGASHTAVPTYIWWGSREI